MWDEPTEEEREEDLHEDMYCARVEAESATQFIRPQMLARPFERPRPVIVCLSRDVPGIAKSRIAHQLDQHLPGLTLHIDNQNNMGLDVGQLQRALSDRCALIDPALDCRRLTNDLYVGNTIPGVSLCVDIYESFTSVQKQRSLIGKIATRLKKVMRGDDICSTRMQLESYDISCLK